MSREYLRPGQTLGSYPERESTPPSWFDAIVHRMTGPIARRHRARQLRHRNEVDTDEARFGSKLVDEHLQPGSRRAAEIHDGRSAWQRRHAPQQLLELVGGA